MRQVYILVLALALLLMAALPVAAVPPDRFSLHEEFTDPAVVNCAELWPDEFDFVVDNDIVFNTDWTTYFDKAGNPIRLHVHASGEDNLYNRDNPAYVVTGKFHWNFNGDPATIEGTITGVFWQITLPGYGAIFFDAGKANFNMEEGYVPLYGHHELDKALCDVLDTP